MKLIQKTLVCNASIDDELLVRDQLAAGFWAVEAGYNSISSHDPACLPAWHRTTAGIALSVSSGTALRSALGPALIDWLERAGRIVTPLAGLALHELIANAAVHGNLGVSSKHLNIWQDLSAREAAIAASHVDPMRRDRLVTIAIGWNSDEVVAIVSDEGDGYETEHPLASGRAAGRGLQIARAVGRVEVFNGGRQAVLTLDCRSAAGDD